MGFFSELLKGVKDVFTGNPLGAVTSLASGLSSIGATKRQKKLMDHQDRINDENYARDRADAIADYQRQLSDQKAMIADERQYNSIGSQMQRARDAGVSPLAALGVSSGSTLTSVSPVSQADSKGVSPTANDGAQRLGNSMTMLTSLSELKLRKEQMAIDKREADARIQRENAEADKIRQETRNLAWDELAKKFKSEPKWLQQEFENLRSQGKLTEANDLLARAKTTTENVLRPVLLSKNENESLYYRSLHLSEEYLRESKLYLNNTQAENFAQAVFESRSRENLNYRNAEEVLEKLSMYGLNRSKLEAEINNLYKLHERMVAEIAEIYSNVSLTNAKKASLIAQAVRDYATSGTSVARTINDIVKKSDNNKADRVVDDMLGDLALSYILN